MNSPHWIEKIYAPDDTQRDSVSGEFFKNTQLESVVREAIQNSLDARDPSAGTSVVREKFAADCKLNRIDSTFKRT